MRQTINGIEYDPSVDQPTGTGDTEHKFYRTSSGHYYMVITLSQVLEAGLWRTMGDGEEWNPGMRTRALRVLRPMTRDAARQWHLVNFVPEDLWERLPGTCRNCKTTPIKMNVS